MRDSGEGGKEGSKVALNASSQFRVGEEELDDSEIIFRAAARLFEDGHELAAVGAVEGFLEVGLEEDESFTVSLCD